MVLINVELAFTLLRCFAKSLLWVDFRKFLCGCLKLIIFYRVCIQYISYMKVTWHVAKYGDPYSEFVLCIYPSKVHTHSSEHTHTPWTHTRSSGQPFMLRHPGSSCGFGAQGHLSRGIEGEESAVHSLPPTYNSCRPETRTPNLWVTSPTL